MFYTGSAAPPTQAEDSSCTAHTCCCRAYRLRLSPITLKPEVSGRSHICLDQKKSDARPTTSWAIPARKGQAFHSRDSETESGSFTPSRTLSLKPFNTRHLLCIGCLQHFSELEARRLASVEVRPELYITGSWPEQDLCCDTKTWCRRTSEGSIESSARFRYRRINARS